MILITGGMGFIGLHTARCFLDAGPDVVLTQFKARREPEFLKAELGTRARVESLDVVDGPALQALMARYPIDGIVHLAVPGYGTWAPDEEYRTNMLGLLNVLEAARAAGVRRVTHASSISVYASVPQGPWHEADPLPLSSKNPTEAYKKAEEILAGHYADRTGLDVRFARLGFIYGPLYHSMVNLPSRLCHAAVKGIPPEFPAPRGAPHADDETDFCYVKDAARGLFLLQTVDGLQHPSYNLGGGRPVTNQALAAAVQQVVPSAHFEAAAGHSPQAQQHAYMDITYARTDLGFEPIYSIEQGVADYIGWLRANPQ